MYEFRLLAKRDGKHSDTRAGRGHDSEGIALPIDPERLVEEVVPSPRIQRWQVDIFRALIERLEFKRPQHESSLLTSPF